MIVVIDGFLGPPYPGRQTSWGCKCLYFSLFQKRTIEFERALEGAVSAQRDLQGSKTGSCREERNGEVGIGSLLSRQVNDFFIHLVP